MKINSRDLFDYINGYLDNKEAKFKVFHNENYVTDIFWDGENFNWESGTFTSGAFFDPLYNFYLIEEDKEIKKLGLYDIAKQDGDAIEPDTILELDYEKVSKTFNKVYDKINELIDKVNNMENNK